VHTVPGVPPDWRSGLREVDRLETDDPALLAGFLESHGLAGEAATQRGDTGIALLLGAVGCARLAGLPEGRPTPVPVPEVVAVAYQRGPAPAAEVGGAEVGEWDTRWPYAVHSAAVEQVLAAIARGEVYQANVVGHRHAPFTGDPAALASAVASRPYLYGGMLVGDGWAVGSASPEQLVRVDGTRITTVPIKGTDRDREALLASAKDRAEHVMIVDLERNDLARVTRAGSVQVEELYALSAWAGLWHATSTVAGELEPGTTTLDVLRALAPGGSVTGAPKRAACAVLAELEPVGRGVSMGAFGFLWPGGLDLGLSIRTIAASEGRVHLWAGGGITWSSDPGSEVREAHAKAAPVLSALAQVRPSSS
jgi:para-aminobenzoate synthetase component 1